MAILVLIISFIPTGGGIGLAFMPSITAITVNFNKYTPIAMGVACSGVGIGTFVFPPIIRWLDAQYGWRGALLLMGGICLQIVIICALLRPMPPLNTDQGKQEHSAGFKQHLNMHICKNISYVLLLIQILFVSIGMSMVLVHLPAYGGTLGFSDDSSAMLLSTMGISNFVGRLAYGATNQIPWITAACLYIIGFIIAGALTVICPLFTSYIALQVYAALFGFLTACFGSMLPLVIVDIVGADLITNGYGYVLLFMAFGTMAGGPVAGRMIGWISMLKSMLDEKNF